VPWQGRALHLGATLGIARSPQDAATPGAALQAADAALVRAKRDRRGGIGMADAGEADRRGRAAAIRRQLRAEAGLDGLAIAFQPVLRCAGPEAGRPLALEAFARWSHPTLGPVPPDQLLSLVGVEEAVRFAAAARRLALAEFAALRRAGGATGRLALNLSAIEVLRPELAPQIAEDVAAAGLGPGDLALEVTEAVLAHRVSDRALERLAGLRAQGAQLWLDDFGTGHADLAQLLRLPLDAVKLDRRFVQALGTEARADALVRAMVALAQGLGLMVIAEAVETEAQAATLRALGCDAMQGYLLARPMPAAALGAWVAA
jgi:EAL domain-containing protein (putative c-di-GMP-specific phosphodiesterase class I)